MTDDQIFDKLIKEKLETESAPFEFSGFNCNDYRKDDDETPCDGWDGYSRRCNCSNRRVGWVLSDCKTYIYAEAW